jgi:replicative DNA helicase
MTQAAEDRLVGCALLEPGTLDVVGLAPSHFVTPLARLSWERMLALHEAGKPVDPVLVAAGQPHEADLLSYLARCAMETTTTSNAEHHADILRRARLTRDVRMAAAEVESAARRGLEGDDLLSEALRLVAGVRSDSRSQAASMGGLLKTRYGEHTAHQDAVASGVTTRTGLPTGVQVLDDLLGGISPGIATIVAGRPGMGKSALGLSMAAANVEAGNGVHVFSLEDTREAYADRLLSRLSFISCEDLSGGRALTLVQQRNLREAAEHGIKRTRGWLFDDRAGIDAAEIVRSVRRNARDNGTRLVIVDYVQLLARTARVKLHEHLGQQLLTFATAAKQDRMAYVVMSQLNRGPESREDKIPRLSDLRESGNLEEYSKCVIAVHRPWVYDRDKDESEMVLCVLKKNQGRIGRARATFDGPRVDVR